MRTRSDERQPVPSVVAGLVALALFGFGEAAPGAFPVEVSIEGHGADLLVTVDGQQHAVSSVVGPGWRSISLVEPGPLDREYQVDGSDTTSTDDRQLPFIRDLLDSPLYGFDAWLRDESSYSRWEHVRLVDLASGQGVDPAGQVPNDFRLDADLRRPEAPARVWLRGATDVQREGLELDRDRRNARWIVQRESGTDILPRWFFPERAAPFAAELVHLLGRSAAAAYALALSAVLLARVTVQPGTPRVSAHRGAAAVSQLILPGWLLAAALVSTRLYHQLPHILDATSYTFQANLFVSGRLWLDPGPLATALRGPFEVLWNGRLFSQYPPGAPAAYALGQLVSLEWLVGPVACVVLLGATSWTARVLFTPACGLAVLCLGALSPFVLFQAGSFLSHPIAGGLLAGALAAFVAGERDGRQRWYLLSGVLLGAGFVTREASSVLFALPLAARLLGTRRWLSLGMIVAAGLPFLGLYLVYNAQLTGSPFLLPRTIFDASDHFGFGDSIGFHTRHTLAAGLANTDELLTLLQFDLFGWPPLFALGLLGVPFLFGRAKTWDLLAAGGVLAFVVAYAAYFYHGVALGPRYYFEAMPWLLLLAGRGAQVLAGVARSRPAAAIVLGVLCLNTVLFYLPAEIARRADFSALPGGQRKVVVPFVHTGVFGPELVTPEPALIVTDDWWLFTTSLATLNCPRVPDCPVLFVLASTPGDVSLLRAELPGRVVLRAVDNAGRVDLHVEDP